ncbi:hypothetical protein pdam_00020297 [Pocillopora damicornis]|uniref:Protein MAK10 homolog n=1 Tax=Pocillopora damicornis TaxID=46731 RepID=A0A3M6UDR8_POCDA|nr:hypothetical protein pdam_00020297 [Pocillopora damicornis]
MADNESAALEEAGDKDNSDELSALTNEVVSGVESITKTLSKLGANEPQYNWEDITDNFTEAASELKLGELVHDNIFGLFEAMSAIEMMDPKMDAGMLCNKAKKVLQFEPAVKAGLVRIKDLTPKELIGIMDELIACLITWLDGHSLVQTVFTCLYMHNPFIIEDPCLKPLKTRLREEPNCDLDTVKSQVKEYEAVLARLKFYKSFYLTLVALEKSEGSGVASGKQSLSTALSLIEPIRKTVELGVQPISTGDNRQGSIMGFEPLVNQRLLPPSFPRYTAIFGRNQAIDYTEEMVKRFLHICDVVNYASLHIVIDFVSEFSKKRPCVLTRSYLQLLVWRNNNLLGRAETIRDAIKAFNSPPSIAEKSSLSANPKASDLADSFINRAFRPVKSIIHALGHNRARQRDKLAHLLEEFAALQDEADKVDAQLHTLLIKVEPQRQHFACFGSWVLYHTLNIMIQYLLSGFELELYSPHEYHYVFWYLDFLFGWHMTCLNRAEKLLQAQETALELIIVLLAIEGFEMQNKTRKPADKFGSEQTRYERRFMPFQAVDTPQPMYYAHYKEYSNLSKMNASQNTDLFVMASNSFQQAKSIFEVVNNVHSEVALLLKVTKTNLVVTKLAAGGHKHDSKIPPEFDFQCHRAFPIIKLK